MLRTRGLRRREPPQGLTSEQHGDQLPHPRSEILALTGVRAIAAIAVVLHHIEMPPSAPDRLRNLVTAGYIGVPLFFMLSGLVLAWNYSTLTPGAGAKVWRFYIARIARVMPLYWVVLLYLVLMRAARDLPQDASLWRHFLAIQSWSGNWHVGARSYNAPGWSICVEVFLYALFPFLVPVIAMIARRWGARGLVLVIAVCWAVQLALVTYFSLKGYADQHAREPTSAHRWLYRNPLTRLPDFVIGMSLAFILLRGFTIRLRTANILHLVCLAYVVYFGSTVRDTGFVRAMWYGAMWTVPFALLLLSLAAAPRAVLSRFLSTRGMVALGTASYALYLTHRPLLPGFGQALVQKAGGITAYVMVLVILGLCLLIAEGAHRYIEVPCRRGILRLVRRPARPDPSPPPEPRPAAEPNPPAGTGPDEVPAEWSRSDRAEPAVRSPESSPGAR